MSVFKRYRDWLIRRDKERYAARREYLDYQIEQTTRIAFAVAKGIAVALDTLAAKVEKGEKP